MAPMTVGVIGAALVALSGAPGVRAQVNLDDVNAGCQPGGCSGNGECVNGTCVCNPMWSSNADFIIVQDCSLSLIGMYILWSVTLLVCFVVLYKTSWVVIARFENFFQQRKTNKGYSLLKNPGLVAVIMGYTFGIPGVAIMAVLHYIDPAVRVGFDPLATCLFFIAKCGLYGGAMFLQGPLLAAALKGERAFDRLVKFNFRFNILVNSMAIMVGGIPFITLVNFQGNIPKQFEIIRAYYFCQALVLFMQFLESYLVKLRLNFVLKRASNLMSTDKTSSILTKVNAVQNTIIKSAVVQCAINIIMGAVPYLLNKHAYFLPISWIAIPILAKNVALQIELDKKGTKTVAQRFKNMVGATSQTSNDRTNNSSVAPGGNNMMSNKVMASEQLVPSMTATGNFETHNPIHLKQTSQVCSTDGMEDLLSSDNAINRKKFADFVRAKFAGNSLAFYDAITEYEQCEPKKRKVRGDAIIRKFVVDASPDAIDFPSEMKDKLLLAQSSGQYTATTFTAAKTLTFELLKYNFYHKFMAQEEKSTASKSSSRA